MSHSMQFCQKLHDRKSTHTHTSPKYLPSKFVQNFLGVVCRNRGYVLSGLRKAQSVPSQIQKLSYLSDGIRIAKHRQVSWVTCRILRTFQVWPRAVLAPGLWPVQRKEREKNRFLNYIRICANYVYGYVAFQSKILNSFDFALFYPLNKTCLKGARFFPYFISVPFFQINMKAY